MIEIKNIILDYPAVSYLVMLIHKEVSSKKYKLFLINIYTCIFMLYQKSIINK
jgi:hypothetical protein